MASLTGTAPPVVLPYSGGRLDRAAELRTDPDWVRDLLGRPETRLITTWRDRFLVDGTSVRPAWRQGASARSLLDLCDEPVLLGLDSGTGVFAGDLSVRTEEEAVTAVGATATLDLRSFAWTLPAHEASTLAYARGLHHWHRNQRFCGTCGEQTTACEAGHARRCPGCDRLWFPRIEPAVIVLVEAPDRTRCLLLRHRHAAPGSFSTLAGFVEVGESLEDAVHREVGEEVGLRLAELRYLASQAWPFPAGLMLGYRARASAETVAVDGTEVVEARWFTPAQVRDQQAASTRDHPPDSIEHFLIDDWLREHPA
ncbi:NAD+ diphosphatase [Actinopolymorpha cephalotaxi]|uniref:NAD(+) diphosphatase n=1 Tax=Actinopolymorpha cephalotaxi TaxID=504797 RepID=A0A1I2LTI0_9ACTN|nr:NAD(+) diphosphatase [Actinopolymorpha cephalotaxi]NYH81355.1 NAD+ diphosphatase [Actinopolymorpha cephalotaxi]SFF80381.1 NAD+ diphosphatase [Actinopolymorpha cephalotaxi]